MAEHVVEEAVLLVPELVPVHADTIHGSGDPEEVLVEFGGELLVDRVVQRELQRDLQHALTVERHPRRAVGLLEVAACGQRGAAVEDADVVEPEEPPLEDVLAVTVLAIDPPREVHQKLLEAFFQKSQVTLAAQRLLVLIHEPRGPRVHGGVDVPEVPLVGGNLSVRMHVLLSEHQLQLLLGEIGIDDVERGHVKGQIPGRVPRVFPLVGHRDDVAVHHVRPLRITDRGATRFVRIDAVLVEPAPDVVVENLLAPEHPRERLAHHASGVRCDARWRDGCVELVGLSPARVDDRVEVAEGPARKCRDVAGREAQPNHRALARLHGDLIVRGDLRASLGRIHRIDTALHEIVVDRVLHPRAAIGRAEESFGVGLVLGEQQRRAPVTVEVAFSELGMGRRHHTHSGGSFQASQSQLRDLAAP